MTIPDTDFALRAVSKIFDVMVWNKTIPMCYFQWVRKNFLGGVWQLRVKPFKLITCKSRIENNGILDVEYFECGFNRPVKGYSMGGFKNKHIAKGDHENLHQVIHCLIDSGVSRDSLSIEEWFKGSKPDVLGKIGEDYTVVELGKLSSLDKFSLVDAEGVKEFWFGDTNTFIYVLSRKASRNEQSSHAEGKNFFQHFVDYYQTHCNGRGRSSCISSPYNAWNCVEIRRVAEDFLRE